MTRFTVIAFALVTASVSAQPATPEVTRSDAFPKAENSRRAVAPEVAAVLSVAATGATVGVGYLLDQRPSDSGVGAVVILGGLLVGPSVGNLVQRNDRAALIGFGVRSLGLGLVIGGVIGGLSEDLDSTSQLVVVGSGFVLGAAGIVYDVVSAGRYRGRVVVAPSVDGRTGAALARVRVGL